MSDRWKSTSRAAERMLEMLFAYNMGGVLHTVTLTVFVGMVLLPEGPFMQCKSIRGKNIMLQNLGIMIF